MFSDIFYSSLIVGSLLSSSMQYSLLLFKGSDIPFVFHWAQERDHIVCTRSGCSSCHLRSNQEFVLY